MDRLKIFVKKSQSEENDSYISHLDMYSEFVTSMFWNSIDPDEENNWMNFDIQRLEEILQNPFLLNIILAGNSWRKLIREIKTVKIIKMQEYRYAETDFMRRHMMHLLKRKIAILRWKTYHL